MVRLPGLALGPQARVARFMMVAHGLSVSLLFMLDLHLSS